MRRFIRFAVVITGVLLLVLLVAGAIAYRATQQVPEFYEAALLQESPEDAAAAGDLLEQNVLDLSNDVREQGTWEAVFTDAQVNGWLAYDLPDKFSSILPPGVQQPRVDIGPEEAQIACRFDNGRISSVVSFGLEVEMTEQPNVVAVRVRSLRAGLLPLPLKQFLDRITAAARNADIELRWTQTDGDPVALVTVPSRHEQYDFREIFLDQVELRDGEVYLSGRTETPQIAMGGSGNSSDTHRSDHASSDNSARR